VYKREIFLFMVILNFGLLFMGLLLTLVLMLFGLSWATYRVSRPTYEVMDFETYFAQLPMVSSKFHEGVLDVSTHKNWKNISNDEKIKSLRILYENNEQNNIGRIKQLLSDGSEEARLYAFSLISSYEKELNDNLKKLHKHIDETTVQEELDNYRFLLAETYWQFIFHGVADSHLIDFYTQKIEEVLGESTPSGRGSVLLGKIYLFNQKYNLAKSHFHNAIALGIPEHFIYTYLAEIEYELKNYNAVPQYIVHEDYNLMLKMKPLYQMWRQ
ncbi:MAG: hypothetical protein K0U38_02345, partial [Epsilonproteobacteria bacterium]|nr:hypothetical protein [Campylobacterota bacterium]